MPVGALLILGLLSSDALTFVRSDSKGRILVVIDGDDKDSYSAYVFHSMAKAPTLPPQTYRATVNKSTGRLQIDSETPPLHLDLYLPSQPEDAKLVGELPSLQLNGLALREFKISRAAGSMDSVISDQLRSLVGSADHLAVKRVGNRVVKDRDCDSGGAGSLYAPGFKCPGRRPHDALYGWMGSSGEAEKLECADGYYACGFCAYPPHQLAAIQECRPYVLGH